MQIFGREPVAIVTVVMAVIAVLATYGLNVVPDTDKFASALGLVLTLIAGGAITRQSVTPTASPSLPQGTVVEVVTPAGQPNTSTTL